MYNGHSKSLFIVAPHTHLLVVRRIEGTMGFVKKNSHLHIWAFLSLKGGSNVSYLMGYWLRLEQEYNTGVQDYFQMEEKSY